MKEKLKNSEPWAQVQTYHTPFQPNVPFKNSESVHSPIGLITLWKNRVPLQIYQMIIDTI